MFSVKDTYFFHFLLVILLTVCHTILLMLVWRFGIASTCNPLTNILLWFFFKGLGPAFWGIFLMILNRFLLSNMLCSPENLHQHTPSID